MGREMIGDVTLGTNKLPRATEFCDGCFGDLDGIKPNVFCIN